MSNGIPIASPIRTQAIVNRYFMHTKKDLGQNFLVGLAAIKGVVKAVSTQSDGQVIGIRPGIGSLAEQLFLIGAKALAYEVDQDLPEILKNELSRRIGGEELNSHFKLVTKDVLEADFTKDSGGFLDLNKPVKVVANLPYYITAPITFNLIKSDLDLSSLTLMMQKEVAERLVVIPKTEEYGSLTITVQGRVNVELAEEVKSTSFMPCPKVGSAIVALTPFTEKPNIDDYSSFDHVVKMCSAQRHKTLANDLGPLVRDKDMRKRTTSDLGLGPRVRPEELTLNQLVELAHPLEDQQAQNAYNLQI